MQLTETNPIVDVNEREYQRLLGLPPEYVMAGRMAELAQWASQWYAERGRPWVYARKATSLDLKGEGVRLEGTPLGSRELLERLKKAEAHDAVLVAIGAGPEAEEEARLHWDEERPDQYFFLEIYASAVVEHLTTAVGARLCEWADQQGMAVLPHYSPGYQGWDLRDQKALLQLMQNGSQTFPSRLEILSSGMLRPKKSQLAVFGLTRQTELTARLTELVPCHTCSYSPCRYRRAAYRMADYRIEGVPRTKTNDEEQVAGRAAVPDVASPLTRDAKYGYNEGALKRWSKERLNMERRPDGGVHARFLFDGNTCSNMGRPLAFIYTIELAPPEAGYRIVAGDCRPPEGDEGYKLMCSALENPELAMIQIQHEKPLLDQPLDDVLEWEPNLMPSGCLCSRAGRLHKWRLALQTLHYRLVKDEEEPARNA